MASDKVWQELRPKLSNGRNSSNLSQISSFSIGNMSLLSLTCRVPAQCSSQTFLEDNSRLSRGGTAVGSPEGGDDCSFDAGGEQNLDSNGAGIGVISVSASVAKKVLLKRKCERCRAGFYSLQTNVLDVVFREELYPSDNFVNAARHLLKILKNIFSDIAHHKNLLNM